MGFEVEIHDGKKKFIKYTGKNPNVVIPDDVDIIGKSAFNENQTLTSITIPGNVSEIEGDFWWDGICLRCSNLVNVTLHEGLKRSVYSISGITQS